MSVPDLTPAFPSDAFHNRETSHVILSPLDIRHYRTRLLPFHMEKNGIIALETRVLSIRCSVRKRNSRGKCFMEMHCNILDVRRILSGKLIFERFRSEIRQMRNEFQAS